jgi:hypothetical protein
LRHPASGIGLVPAHADDFGIATSHAARGRWQWQVLRLMTDIHVGDDVTLRGRILRIRGISPMSASPRRVLLEDLETGESIEARLDEIEPAEDELGSAG